MRSETRVVITMNGKLLPLIEQKADDNTTTVREYEMRDDRDAMMANCRRIDVLN